MEKKHTEEFNFWQPASDLLSGLLLVLLLIIVLLGLYLVHYSKEEIKEVYETEYENETEGEEENKENDDDEYKDDAIGDTYNEEDDEENENTSGGGGGGGESEHETEESESETERQTEVQSGGSWGEDGIKTAVFAKLVDEETRKTVKIKDVDFELYGHNGNLQILNTYYPEKISYRDFLTRKDGTFFLPEKIFQGSYFFRQISEIEGYDNSGDTYFDVNEMYDWPEPYVVEIPISPSKNIIRVAMLDSDTKDNLSGWEFNVISVKDVVTADGELRYKRGEIVDKIKTDTDGVAESKELFLGEYKLQEVGIPEYYASIPKDVEIKLEKKKGTEEPVNEIENDKTRFTVSVQDSISEEQIEGAEITVSTKNNSVDYKLGITSEIIEDLEKTEKYTITSKLPEGYYKVDSSKTLTVDAKGRINNLDTADIVFKAEKTVIEVTVVDQYGTNAPDINTEIRDSNGKIVDSWTSGTTVHRVESLPEGNYLLKATNGDEIVEEEITISEIPQTQDYKITVHLKGAIPWMWFIIGGVSLLGVLLIVLILLIRKRHKKKKKVTEVEEEKE